MWSLPIRYSDRTKMMMDDWISKPNMFAMIGWVFFAQLLWSRSRDRLSIVLKPPTGRKIVCNILQVLFHQMLKTMCRFSEIDGWMDWPIPSSQPPPSPSHIMPYFEFLIFRFSIYLKNQSDSTIIWGGHIMPWKSNQFQQRETVVLQRGSSSNKNLQNRFDHCGLVWMVLAACFRRKFQVSILSNKCSCKSSARRS